MTGSETFRRLARSSPWLWRSVRLTLDDDEGGAVRAWIRRPDALRVETPGGTLLHAQPGDPAPPGMSLLESGACTTRPDPDGSPGPPSPTWWTDPGVAAPVRDTDGLVVELVDLPPHVAVDDPMWQNYRWVAMLNPRELADGVAGTPGVAVDLVSAGVRHGRPTLYATLRPLEGYDPRCTCCPLLPCRQAVLADGYGDPDAPFADAHRVALDLATGICVLAREIGGPRNGRGFDVVLEEVDQPYEDALFLPPPRDPVAGPGGRWAAVPGMAPERRDDPSGR